MRYFKGSRRSVKKSSHSLKDDSSASKTAVDSSLSGRTQRKRPHIVDTAETGQTKRSKKSKQSSSSKTCIAASGRDHATNKNDTRTPSDNDQPIIKRKKQVIPTGSLSSSESEESLHLSDQSDSLHVTVCNTRELGEQSDRKFLQQQIKILKTQFQLENDCPALSRIKVNDSNHIPLQVILNTLRKVNHKTEDDVLRSLNRLAQRKLLDSLSAVRPESSVAAAISDEQLKRYKEVQTRVANLEKAHHEMIQEHAQCEHIGVLVSQMEAISKEFNQKDLVQEIQKTNDFLASSSPPTTSKTQKLNNINAGARPRVDASGYIPSTHEQLVQILFKD